MSKLILINPFAISQDMKILHIEDSEIKKVIVISSLKTDEYQTQFLSNLAVYSIQQKPISIQNLLFQVEQELSH